MWEEFVAGFCEVEFLCHEGEPNWLGWITLVIGAVTAIWLYVVVSDAFRN